MTRSQLFVLFCLITLSSVSSFAQSAVSSNSQEVGAFVGNLLPNGVPGLDEIMPLWGLRYSHPLGTGVYAEGGGIFGHSHGVLWQGAFTSLRMDIPLETMIAFALIGLDVTRLKPSDDDALIKGGGHAGGGLMSQIGGNVWARFDMKLNSQPGTSLYFSLGIAFTLGGGSSAP